jgi:DNA invertase Pin-like site-specific DNA recombinase
MMKGWKLADIFIEAGVSGSVPLAERPEGHRLLQAVSKGAIVITAKLDRMFRSAADALVTLEELKRQGVALHMIDLGGDVTGNGISKMVFLRARRPPWQSGIVLGFEKRQRNGRGSADAARANARSDGGRQHRTPPRASMPFAGLAGHAGAIKKLSRLSPHHRQEDERTSGRALCCEPKVSRRW